MFNLSTHAITFSWQKQFNNPVSSYEQAKYFLLYKLLYILDLTNGQLPAVHMVTNQVLCHTQIPCNTSIKQLGDNYSKLSPK